MPHEQTPGDSANAEPVFLTIPTRSSSRGGVSLTNKQTKQLSPHLRCPAAHAVNKNNTNNSWELMNIWRWSSRVGLDFSPLQDSVRDRVYCSHGWTGSYGIWGTNMAELLRTESGDKRHFYLLLNKSTVLRIRTFFFFPPLVQSRQFRNSYWPAYQNSPSGNFRYWLLRIIFFLFYLLSFHIFPIDSGRPTEDISPIRGFCLSGTGRTAVD